MQFFSRRGSAEKGARVIHSPSLRDLMKPQMSLRAPSEPTLTSCEGSLLASPLTPDPDHIDNDYNYYNIKASPMSNSPYNQMTQREDRFDNYNFENEFSQSNRHMIDPQDGLHLPMSLTFPHDDPKLRTPNMAYSPTLVSSAFGSRLQGTTLATPKSMQVLVSPSMSGETARSSSAKSLKVPLTDNDPRILANSEHASVETVSTQEEYEARPLRTPVVHNFEDLETTNSTISLDGEDPSHSTTRDNLEDEDFKSIHEWTTITDTDIQVFKRASQFKITLVQTPKEEIPQEDLDQSSPPLDDMLELYDETAPITACNSRQSLSVSIDHLTRVLGELRESHSQLVSRQNQRKALRDTKALPVKQSPTGVSYSPDLLPPFECNSISSPEFSPASTQVSLIISGNSKRTVTG